MNIIEQFTYYKIYISRVNNPQIVEYLQDALSFGEDIVTTSGNEISYICERFNDNKWIDEAVDFSSAETDLAELEDWLTSHLGNRSHYLVFAKSCTWRGASGFKFCDNVNDTLFRNYDATFIFKKDIKNGIEILESSHDVPTGSPTYIFGLTNKEFDKLEDAEFDTIEAFVNERI